MKKLTIIAFASVFTFGYSYAQGPQSNARQKSTPAPLTKVEGKQALTPNGQKANAGTSPSKAASATENQHSTKPQNHAGSQKPTTAPKPTISK